MGWKQKKNREKLVFTLIKALLNNKIRFVTGVPPSISEWFLKKSFRLIVFLLYSDQILLSCSLKFVRYGQYAYCDCLLNKLFHNFWN